MCLKPCTLASLFTSISLVRNLLVSLRDNNIKLACSKELALWH